MGQTLTNGVYLPDEGERNCYTGLAGNWRAVDEHLGDANIHVTYADKEAWNNHVADTVKHVTAEDKTKWDAVTTKANDAAVMHLTGDETADGNKTFNGNTNCVGELNQTVPFKMTSDTSFVTGTKNSRIYDQNGFLCANEPIIYNNSKNIRRAWYLYNNSSGATVSAGFNFILSASGQKVFYPLSDSDTDNGSSSAYWKNTYSKLINGINPGSLFLPQDRSARVDISAYFTNTANGANNTLVSPADGYIYLHLTDVVTVHCSSQNASTLTNYSQTFACANAGLVFCMFPVRKNDNVLVQWYTTAAAVTVSNAYFIPCKGNV